MNNDRGMMKWMPYRSLPEQETYLAQLQKEKAKRSKPQLSEEMAEEINSVLVHYHGQTIQLTYWQDGFLFEEVGIIQSMITWTQRLIINDIEIPFSSIVDVQSFD